MAQRWLDLLAEGTALGARGQPWRAVRAFFRLAGTLFDGGPGGGAAAATDSAAPPAGARVGAPDRVSAGAPVTLIGRLCPTFVRLRSSDHPRAPHPLLKSGACGILASSGRQAITRHRTQATNSVLYRLPSRLATSTRS